jgi:deoxyribodipyrimidine photo-lyase
MTKPVIMWFRQDLRLSDHPALAAAAAAGPVIPLYILDDETPGEWRWGGASRWWLDRSLAALGGNVPLVLRRGPADRIIGEVLQETEAAALFFTRDYAPWSSALESRVNAICGKHGAACRRFGGFLLHEPEQLRTGKDEPYRVYTPFSRACFARGEPRDPLPVPKPGWWQGKVAGEKREDWKLSPSRPDWSAGFSAHWQPGEQGARLRLRQFLEEGLAAYARDRDKPALSVTSRLSPHLHWGEISPAGKSILRQRSSSRKCCGGSFPTIFFTTGPICRRSRFVPSLLSSPGRTIRRRSVPGSAAGRAIPSSMPECVSYGRQASCTTGCG